MTATHHIKFLFNIPKNAIKGICTRSQRTKLRAGSFLYTMAKPRQESIKSRDGPRLLRVVDLYVKGGRAAAREQ